MYLFMYLFYIISSLYILIDFSYSAHAQFFFLGGGRNIVQ